MFQSNRALRMIVFAVFMMTIVGMGLLWSKKGTSTIETRSASKASDDMSSQPISAVAQTPSPIPVNSQSPNTEAYQVPQAEKLQSFQKIQDKVFASGEEESQRKSLLRDRAFIQDMGAFLLDRRRFAKMGDQFSQQMEKDQDSAVDFLLAALKDGDKTFAETTIINIIKDGQVEDGALAMDQREMLAGLKGELLFHGSSISPQGFQNITSVLPGPVSLRIWQNVQARQSQYAEESMGEKVAHDQRFGN
jgi:hypothetical protein